MEYQVQRSVLVDGEWVSRTADVYQIMSRNQQYEDVEMEDADTSPSSFGLEVGILSKTVIGSPLYSTIIPANIRHKDLDDVVFVGENFVQLKEICDYGHLRHIATKSDFKGKILAAKVFGDPRKVQINTSVNSPLLKVTSPLHRGRRSITGEEIKTVPLEVIVLTLTTRTLMFLWAKNNHNEPTSFIHKTVQLPGAASRFNRPGQYLAIDPRCRAIAVAAAEGCFMFYKTKTMETWRRDMRAGHDEVPIVEEAQFSIDGRIMHMDFLSAADDTHVVLVFILVHEGRSKVASYDWDLRNSLDTMPRVTRSVLDFDNRHPSLLIPLSRSTDFLLVQSEHISVCRGVLAGPPITSKTMIPARFLRSPRPGSNKGKSLWVQWDRAPRNPDFAKEAFYLAREDGTIIYVELGDVANSLEISDAGSWPYPIDTAFACLKADSSEFAQSYPDVLVAGGFGSDGHLCKVGAWPKEYTDQVPYSQTNVFGFVESLPNWAPLTDMEVTRLANLPFPYDRERANIFVSHGKAPYGEISQLRHGLRALVDETFEGMKGSTGLWIIDYGNTTSNDQGNLKREDYATFVVNAPPETLVLRATRTQEEGSYGQGTSGSIWEGGVWETDQPTDDDLIRNVETISACSITESLAVQITSLEARLIQRPQLNQVGAVTFSRPLLGAAAEFGIPFIVVAIYEGTQSTLQIIPVSDDGPFQIPVEETSRCTLSGDPTCINILVSEDGPLIFVGIADVGFCLFAVHEQVSLTRVYDTHSSVGASRRLQQVYERAILLKTRDYEKLVCGTRTGLLISIDLAKLKRADSASKSHEPSMTKMGSSAVYVTQNRANASTAFVACGADFCRAYLSNRDFEVHIDSIWLDDPQCPTYMQGALNAIDQTPVTAAPSHELDGYMFAVFGDRMVYARLDYDIQWSGRPAPAASPEDAKIVPRKLPTMRTPTRLLLAEDLPHHMIVVANELKEENTPSHNYRSMLSSIKIIDLLNNGSSADAEINEEVASGTPKKKLEKAEIPLKNQERVHAMVRWVFLGDENRQHALLVVGTGITESPGNETGRRLVLNVTKSGLKLQDKKRFDAPVRCIAVYDNQHILSIVGRTLQLEQIERTEAARWKRLANVSLPSPGVHMTVSRDSVYVSTSHDSHLCFRITKLQTPQGERFDITQIFSDSRQRPSLRHLVYKVEGKPDPQRSDAQRPATVVLLTDKNASITGLLEPQHASNKIAAATLFEACLPRSVIRIQRGNIRPPWRRIYKHDVHDQTTAGVLNDDLIGGCTDGSIIGFSTISGPALDLLRLLQNLIEAKEKRDPALQFSTVKHMSGYVSNLLQDVSDRVHDSTIKARDVDPDMQRRGPAAPRFRHVDGDLLYRFLELDGRLKNLVEDGCDGDVWKLFAEKETAMFGVSPGERGKNGIFAAVESWLKEILMPLL